MQKYPNTVWTLSYKKNTDGGSFKISLPNFGMLLGYDYVLVDFYNRSVWTTDQLLVENFSVDFDEIEKS